jgi:3-hydroxy-9,10-secoandrosta-1,3,5(10)-triene-9,17-dione monooxygenase
MQLHATLPSAATGPRLSGPLLSLIAAQAVDADRTRSVSDEVIRAIKASDLMRMAASGELGGLNSSIADIAEELSAVAAACGSTGWCLWNHLLVFHFFCTALGPAHADLLRAIVRDHEWCSYAAGAGTSVVGHADEDRMQLNGRAAFASGARYGEWAGVPFKMDTDPDFAGLKYMYFTIVRTDAPGVRVERTWESMSLRASATDHIAYDNVSVPLAQCVKLEYKFRERFRRADEPVIHSRYREDFVGVSSLWLAAEGIGVARAALEETCLSIRDRIAIMGVKMVNKPTVQVNLGQAAALIGTAQASIRECCRDTDLRIAAGVAPSEDDYLQQTSRSMMALEMCESAMRLVLRVLGANGLRESASFERRFRDLQAMPLHMNVHHDRVSEQYGRHLIGLPTNNFY